MGKHLIIVESPAKAKTIGKFAGNSYLVKASMGHIRDLPKSSLGVDVENNFKPKYVTSTTKKKVIHSLREAAKQADKIYLASDHDREGEAIAWHLTQVLKKEIKGKEIHRIVFNEITRSAIQKALQKPGEIDDKKVESQQARRILDRIVGYTLSPMLWKVITKNLSAGRVQSVALRLICEREEKIKAFEPKEYWSITATIGKDEYPTFRASLHKWQDKKVEISNEKEAIEIFNSLKQEKFKLDSITTTEKKTHPLPPYITSTLQQDAARVLNFSAKKTMMVAQQLYEGIDLDGETVGLISYMRTDSLRIANEALESVRNLVTERFTKEYLHEKTRVFKNKSSAQDAHEAIRPTDPFRTPERIKPYLSIDQQKLYHLIWSRFVATQMKPILMKNVQIKIKAGEGLLIANGSSILFEGFRKAFPYVVLVLGETIDPAYLNIEQNEHFKLHQLDKKQNFTKPPARYREATLIKELESKGIGRPSTYASIINTIVERKYVKLFERKFHPTDLGTVVNLFLIKNFEKFFNTEFTAKMENNLDEIEYGNINWHEILSHYYEEMKQLMTEVDVKKSKQELVEKTGIPCEKCDGELVIKWGRNGSFLACSNYPDCNEIHNYEKDEDGKITILRPQTTGEKCPDCDGELILKNGRFGKFIACSNYPNCKFTKPFTLGIKCPDCETGEITEKKNKKGRIFYSCSNYPDCKFISNYKPAAIKCSECGNFYLEERVTKQKGNYKRCPKCGKEYY